MNQQDNIKVHFRTRVEVGETTFKIQLPRYKIEDGYTFSFEALTLIPEFYSQQAQALDYDSTAENATPINHPFQLEFYYDGDYYDKTGDKNKWTMSTLEKTHALVLQSLNTFFDKIRPAGSVYPPVTFDWINPTYYDAMMEINEFHSYGALTNYGVDYDAAVHNNWLPASHRRPGITNNLMYPTEQSDPAMSSVVKIRMFLAPNVKIGFSNDSLLSALGFIEGQYEPKKTLSSQIIFENPRTTTLQIDAGDVPKTILPSSTNRITVYQYDKKQVSRPGVLSTVKGNLKKFDKLAEDYNKPIKELAKTCNQVMGLEFNDTTKTFKIVYPDNPKVKTDITVPQVVSQELGYGREVTRIKSDTTPTAVEFAPEIKNLEHNARTLVYDVGMAQVEIEDSVNLQTVSFHNKVMANLEPEFDGTMRMRCSNVENSPQFIASYFGTPEVTFRVSRFSEDMKPVSLGLPVGAYIQGTLLGKRIKGESRV